MNILVLPGDEFARTSDQAVDLIDTTLIKHNKALKFAVCGEVTGIRPLLLNNRHYVYYFPLSGHPVLANVYRRHYGGYLVDIGCAYLAFLCQNSTHKMQLEPGYLMAAVITYAKIGHYTELKMERVLQGGFLKCISPHRAAQLMLGDELLTLGKYFKFDIWIGLNGFLYLSQCSAFDAEGVYECLTSSEDTKKVVTRRRLLTNYYLM